MRRATTAAGTVFLLAITELTVYLDVLPLRVAGGLTLALFLPGWVITKALPPRTMRERSTRVLLIPALSISTLVIAGVLLYAVGIPLTDASWAIVLGCSTLLGVAAWVLRERRLAPGALPDASDPDDDRPDTQTIRPADSSGHPPRVAATSRGEEDGLLGPREGSPVSVQLPGNRRGGGLRIAVLSMVLVAALEATGAVIAAISGQRGSGPGFTQLWALQSQHKPLTVDVGVRSYERHRARYQIAVTINQRIVMRRAVVLAPTRMWQSTLALGNRVGERVDVRLWMSPSHSVYRHVRIWTGAASPTSLAFSGRATAVAILGPRSLDEAKGALREPRTRTASG